MVRRVRIRYALVVLAGALLPAACAPSSAGSSDSGREQQTPAPVSTDPFVTGSQSLFDFAPEIEDRVGEVLIGPAVSVEGVRLVQGQTPYMDTELSEVCGNRQGNGVYGGAFGQRREWEGPDLHIQHFASAYIAVTAAKAVEQIGGKLSCGAYRARDGHYRVLGVRELPSFDKVDGRFMFCETRNEQEPESAEYQCTAFVTRAEIASRIQVRAKAQAKAEQVTKQLIAAAAQRLAGEW